MRSTYFKIAVAFGEGERELRFEWGLLGASGILEPCTSDRDLNLRVGT